MAERGFDAEQIINALAPALGLTIDADMRPGVAAFLCVAERMARIVVATPVDAAHCDLAAVFRPGHAEEGA